MISDRIALPFSFPKLYAGTWTGEGVLYCEKEELRLEFECTFLQLFNTGIREAIIPIDDLTAVELKNGWLSQTLAFQGKSLRTFIGIPGNKQGRLQLNVLKKDREQAERLASVLADRLTVRQLNRMQEDLDSL